MKIVYIGAGSHDFGRGQIADVMSAKELKGQNVTIILVDLNEKGLETMAKFAGMVKEHYGADIKIEKTTDRRKALPGADFIITSVARKRYPLWEQDFRIPLAHGFKHILGENGGPGALFHALRSLELIIPICRDVEELCPNALLLNFTNPEARVLHAICTLTKVKAAGICHGFFSAMNAAAQLLGRPVDELHITSAGMNHFYQLLSVKDKKSGKELLGELLDMVKNDRTAGSRLSKGSIPPLFKKMVEIFDMFTYVSDDHIGEYLSYGSEFHGSEWKYGQEWRDVKLQSGPPRPAAIEECVAGKRPLEDWLVKPTTEIVVPIICDVVTGRKSWRPAVNVLNTEHYIENLATNGVVEIPAMVDGDGIHPEKVGPVGEPVAAMIRTQHSIHNLLTEAFRTKDKRMLLQALLLDPVVNSITEAQKMLDEMLKKQSDFLPTFN